MSLIATVGIEAGDFTLKEALSSNSDIHVALERVVPLGSTFIPYFWVKDDTVEDIERALRAETDIESFRVVDTVNGESLVRVEWQEDFDGLLDVIADAGASVLKADGSADSWTFQLRFADHGDLRTFFRECASRDISLDLQSIHTLGISGATGVELDITDTQRETLLLALEKGYFDVPRGINLTELAAEMSISDTALSQRMRRGITAVLTASLVDSEH